MKAISPNRRGVDKSAWNPQELSRGEAESVVKAVFEEIADALNRGETVKLPVGKFEVKQHNRPPLRGWFLNRVPSHLQEADVHRVHPRGRAAWIGDSAASKAALRR